MSNDEQISVNFKRSEFEKNGKGIQNDMPAGALQSYRFLCLQILEPIRERFGKPIRITSGYRNFELNNAVNGAYNSQHMANSEHCACDFQIPGVELVTVFDWIRLKSSLPFDQVILERGKEERHENDDVIHISWVNNHPRREALEGETHNRGKYKRVRVTTLEELSDVS